LVCRVAVVWCCLALVVGFGSVFVVYYLVIWIFVYWCVRVCIGWVFVLFVCVVGCCGVCFCGVGFLIVSGWLVVGVCGFGWIILVVRVYLVGFVYCGLLVRWWCCWLVGVWCWGWSYWLLVIVGSVTCLSCLILVLLFVCCIRFWGWRVVLGWWAWVFCILLCACWCGFFVVVCGCFVVGVVFWVVCCLGIVVVVFLLCGIGLICWSCRWFWFCSIVWGFWVFGVFCFSDGVVFLGVLGVYGGFCG